VDHWNCRTVAAGVTEFHVGWVNYLDEGDAWRPIDCALAAGPTGFTVREAPFFFQAPRFADQAAYFESNCRYDVFAQTRITAAPLGVHLTALDAVHVAGRPFDLGRDGRMDAVRYEGAFPQWNADLIYRVRHGRAPRLEKLIRFHGPVAGDVAARFRVEYTGGVEISPRRIDGPRRAAHWDGRGRLRHREGFYVRAQGEPQKRGIGVGTPRIWDANPDLPKIVEIAATLEAADGGLVLTKHVPGAFFTADVVYPVDTDTTSTFYPDPDPETTSVDGLVRTENLYTWANTRSNAGEGAYPSIANHQTPGVQNTTTSNQFRYNQRGVFLFDTSSIHDAANISAATFSLYGTSKANAAGDINAVLVASSPAGNTDLAATDYGLAAHFGTTELAGRIPYASWSTTGFNDFALNASGLAAISKTGVTKLGVLHHFDFDNTSPTWASNTNASGLWANFAETTGTTTDPKLVVTFTAPTPVLVQKGAPYAVRTTPGARGLAAGYALVGQSTAVQAQATYAVVRTAAALTRSSTYRLPSPVLVRTARYAITLPRLSGVIKDRRGTAIDCTTYNVRINVYPVGNTASPPVATQLVTASNGAWTVTGLAGATKYLVTFELAGTYTPLGDMDIADAAFMTTSL